MIEKGYRGDYKIVYHDIMENTTYKQHHFVIQDIPEIYTIFYFIDIDGVDSMTLDEQPAYIPMFKEYLDRKTRLGKGCWLYESIFLFIREYLKER